MYNIGCAVPESKKKNRETVFQCQSMFESEQDLSSIISEWLLLKSIEKKN